MSETQMYSVIYYFKTRQLFEQNETVPFELVTIWIDDAHTPFEAWTDLYLTVRVWTSTFHMQGCCQVRPCVQMMYRSNTGI